jgi:uncharacterized protein YybS (DUF2232 family)
MKRMEMSPYGYPTVYYYVQIVLRRTCGTHLPEANALIRTLGTHLPKANALIRTLGTHLPQANALIRTLGTHLPQANALVGTLGAHLPQANALIRTLGTHLPQANALVGICGTCTSFIKKSIRYGHIPLHTQKRLRRYIRPPNNRATTKPIAGLNTLSFIFLF